MSIDDGSGALYGTTVVGGTPSCFGILAQPKRNCGTAFKLTPPAPGKTAWTQTILHIFNSFVLTGSVLYGGLSGDAKGNLYGMTSYGGTSSVCLHGCGTVFELHR